MNLQALFPGDMAELGEVDMGRQVGLAGPGQRVGIVMGLDSLKGFPTRACLMAIIDKQGGGGAGNLSLRVAEDAGASRVAVTSAAPGGDLRHLLGQLVWFKRIGAGCARPAQSRKDVLVVGTE